MKKYEFLTALLLSLLLSSAQIRTNHEAMAALISPNVLRLHILADSDRHKDQIVKLEVRSLVLDILSSALKTDTSKAQTIQWFRHNRSAITAAADKHLHDQGISYQASISFVRDYFPDRIYAGTLFPCGYYDAVRITLGSGKGHNWWCVLYPQLCLFENLSSTSDGKVSRSSLPNDPSPQKTKKQNASSNTSKIHSVFSFLFSNL